MEIHGNYNDAVVFTDVIEEEAISQIRQLCDQSFAAGSKIRIMPDVHAGAGCTIGTTMTIRDKIVPNLVGVDIGCGMLTACLGHQEFSFEKLDELIYKRIPSGFKVRETPHPANREIDLTPSISWFCNITFIDMIKYFVPLMYLASAHNY